MVLTLHSEKARDASYATLRGAGSIKRAVLIDPRRHVTSSHPSILGVHVVFGQIYQ
jgi:hypothetical protein